MSFHTPTHLAFSNSFHSMSHVLDHSMSHVIDHSMSHVLDHSMSHVLDHSMSHVLDHPDFPSTSLRWMRHATYMSAAQQVTCMTWLIHICHMTHWPVHNHAFKCVTCHIYRCDKTPSYAQRRCEGQEKQRTWVAKDMTSYLLVVLWE